MYFAWERDNKTGSGFIAYEFMQNAAPASCVFDGRSPTPVIANCNPWKNRQPRAAGDFMILWDQQGGSKDLYLRKWTGTAPNLRWRTDPHLALRVAAYSADGFRGEAAVNVTDAIYGGVQGLQLREHHPQHRHRQLGHRGLQGHDLPAAARPRRLHVDHGHDPEDASQAPPRATTSRSVAPPSAPASSRSRTLPSSASQVARPHPVAGSPSLSARWTRLRCAPRAGPPSAART